MSEELKPCPHCGGTRVHIAGAGAIGVPGVSWVFCDGCLSQGGICDTVEEAVELWNRRAERTCHDEAGSQQSFLCSECGWFWNDQEDELGFSYCPNCGAKVVDE